MDGQRAIPDSLAEEAGISEAAALPSRLERYAVAHTRALDMADYIAGNVPGQAKILEELRTCGSYLVFRDYYTIGKVRLAGMCSCKKHLICQLCALRRGAKYLKNYLGKLRTIQAERPALRPFLVTITIRNGEDLGERYNHLHGSIRRYHKQRNSALRAKGPMVEAAKVAGAVWSYEFKRGDGSGLWHPHLHAVWLCEESPDQERLAREWYAVTGDSFIVNAKPIRTEEDEGLGGFCEVFKYALKFGDMPLADNWHGYQVLKGRRMISSLGCFRGVEEPEDLADELLDEDLPFVELLFRYSRGSGYSFVPPQALAI